MKTFSALLTLCDGNPLVTVGFNSQRPVTQSFDVFFDLRDAGDLRRYRAQYDVTVMRYKAGVYTIKQMLNESHFEKLLSNIMQHPNTLQQSSQTNFNALRNIKNGIIRDTVGGQNCGNM